MRGDIGSAAARISSATLSPSAWPPKRAYHRWIGPLQAQAVRRMSAPRRKPAISWIQLDTAGIPGGGTPLRLMKRGREFSIVVDTIELMNNTRGTSEEALAILACNRLANISAPRVLIGGLGMGFTLRAALSALGMEARVVVAELVPAVMAWARGPLADVFGGCLDDPRVELREAEVGQLIRSEPVAWDAILLDVDNGPEGFVRRENDRLYDGRGLEQARMALRPGGVLGVWADAPDRRFKARLKRFDFSVAEFRIPASGDGGPRHVVWIATTRPIDSSRKFSNVTAQHESNEQP